MCLSSSCTSWTMEEVASKETIAILKDFKTRYRNMVSYTILDMSLLGVPQQRKRLIAGTPQIIAHLERLQMQPTRKCIKDYITKPGGTHIRNSNYSTSRALNTNPNGTSKYIYKKASWSDHCYPISGLSPTVLAHRSNTWVTKNGIRTLRKSMTWRECALLQTFPPSYYFPDAKDKALKQIGNAVPPLVATKIMQFVNSLDTGV